MNFVYQMLYYIKLKPFLLFIKYKKNGFIIMFAN